MPFLAHLSFVLYFIFYIKYKRICPSRIPGSRPDNLTKYLHETIMLAGGKESDLFLMDYQLELNVQSFSGLNDTIRESISAHPSGPVRIDNKIWFQVGDMVYSCADCPEGRELFNHLVTGSSAGSVNPEDAVWRSVLNGIYDPAFCERYKIRDQISRTVILFRPTQRMERFLLQESIPLDTSDRMISMENGDVALILHTKRHSENMPYEYAEAVTETMESEAGIVCYAGIGNSCDSLDALSSSYSEAAEALRTGLQHHLPGRVFSYSKQALERLTELIPPERAASLRQKEIPPEAEKVLSEEMLETIRVFFLNDLNLSTTARQLFIHRNTLLYRMDKIKKATGLDLRKFEDAAVFRFLLSLPQKHNI